MLEKLRAAMAAKNADMFLIPTEDPHGSEYPGEHFKVRQYLSGFTGSAGTLLVSGDRAGLWTDGRYFIQAGRQLPEEIELFKMGEPDTPALPDCIEANAKAGLGADLATISAADGLELVRRGVKLIDCPDVIDGIWPDRPPLSGAPAYSLELRHAGVSAADKLKAVREEMGAQGADALVLNALDDINWLFNIRGNDVKYLPAALCYAAVEKDRAYLFMDSGKAAPILGDMTAIGVRILPYGGIYTFLQKYAGRRVMAAASKLNYKMYLALGGAEIIDSDPIGLMKAVKNPTELNNTRITHIKDGAALTRFICWVKENASRGITEMDAGAKCTEFRREQRGFIEESFATICGYGPNGAIIHYSAAPETNAELRPEGLLLVDSGGQYRGGTTDVTRTIALGPVASEQKKGFTLVLISMLELMNARFPRGCAGFQLDALARAPFWEKGLDFNHGTGHGVGYMLSVHEGPQNIRWNRTGSAALLPGMITSDEPGIYVEGEYGVRLENLLECVEDEEHPGFLRFEPITFAPIDLDAIDLGMLPQRNREQLNRYHAQVLEKLSPMMTEEEITRLSGMTRPV